jgi:hypothetical protein
MILKTLQALGRLHGCGIARRIEQTSGDLLSVNYGRLYPALLKLEQEGYVSSEWGDLRQQPQSQVLQAHTHGPQTTGKGSSRLAAEHRDPRALSLWKSAGLMKRMRSLVVRLFSLFHKKQLDRELDAELRGHLELKNLRAGMTPEAACRAALIKLGGVERRATRVDPLVALRYE